MMLAIKKIQLLLAFILFASIYSYGQVGVDQNVHEHTENCEHNQPCVILRPIDQTQIDATKNKIQTIRNRASSRSMYEFDRSLMPMYIYFPFDAKLLDSYTFDEFKGMVMANIVNGIIESNQCSGVNFNNYRVIFEPIYGISEYSSIYDIQNFISGFNSPLHYLLENKQSKDWHYMLFLTKAIIDGKGVAGMATEVYPNVETVFAVVDFQEVILGSITGIHEIAHLNGLDHEEGRSNSISLPTSRALKADTDSYRSPVASSNVITFEVRCWSGPNSYTVNYLGDSIHIYNGSCNNAATMDIGIELFRDGIDHTMIQVFYDSCGAGTINIATNNADIIDVSVLDGQVDLSATDQMVFDYISYTSSTLRIIGQKTGEVYADTVFINLPEILTATIDTTIAIGGLLPDGTQVDSMGTYVVRIEKEDDCDLFITYNVDVISSNENQYKNAINIYPIPSDDKLFIECQNCKNEYFIYNTSGTLISIGFVNTPKDVSHLENGVYILQLISNGAVISKKVIKN